jgi:hypothetical protein
MTGMRQLWLSRRLAGTYTDLGAIVHDDQGHDLSYRKSGNILIDTSQVATDTID